jgi:hypothetical protein
MNKVIMAVLLGSSVLLSNLVLAEDLIVYQKQTAIKKNDLGDKGDSVGDLLTRTGNLFFKLDGPTVGKYYTNALTTHTDKSVDWRQFTVEFNLPEGEILTMDYVKTESGKPATKGFAARGVILGGTGVYSGIRGSYDKSLDSDEISKVTFHIQK